MKKSITKIVVALGLFAAGAISLAHADDASAKIKLKATPVELQHDVSPEETVEGTFRFYNEGDDPVEYTIIAKPYYADEKDGHLDVTYDETNSPYSEIIQWITFNDNGGTLAPGENTEITYKIAVPKDAPGGGQYAALLISAHGARKENGGTTIGETAEIGPILYAKIKGETRRTAEILSHETSGFYFNPPISASSKVKNTGNVHATAYYTLKVFPFFGGESIYNNEDNPNTMVILPGATRYYNSTWDTAPSIGIYKVESEVKIFDEVSKIERTVIICPMWVLILVVVFILALIFWIVSRVRARKSKS